MKKVIFKYLLVLFFVFCNLFIINKVNASVSSDVPAPTIIKIGKDDFSARPLITGLTIQKTEVLVFIDDIFMGKASINRENTKSDNFYYKPNFDLSVGKHKLLVVSSLNGRESVKNKIQEFTIEELASPILVSPSEKEVISKIKPLIKGLTKNNTKVHLFIDSVYNGKTNFVKHKSLTANFAYEPFLNLEVGEHKVWAVAEDAYGRKSKVSNVLKFRIEKPTPSPVVFKVDYEKNEYNKKPLIRGLVKNDHFIKIFIDNKYNGKTNIIKHNSGVGAFVYKPSLNLKEGKHYFYVTAVDMRGKESRWSEIISFEIKNASSSSLVIDKKVSSNIENLLKNDNETIKVDKKNKDLKKIEDTKKDIEVIDDKKIEEDKKDFFSDTNKDSEEIKNNEKNKDNLEIDKDIIDLLQKDENKSSSTKDLSTSTDDKSTQDNKFKANLAVFLLFLLAIIGWIFWVNREIVKDKTKEE